MSGIKGGLITESLVRDLLAGEAGRASIVVKTSSMAPRILEGDTISVVKATGRSLWPGDIIVFRGDRFGAEKVPLVVHRLIWRDHPLGQPTRVFTKGDAINRLDLSIPAEWVVGRVESISSVTGYRRPTTPFDRIRCLLLAAGYGVRRLFRQRPGGDSATDARRDTEPR